MYLSLFVTMMKHFTNDGKHILYYVKYIPWCIYLYALGGLTFLFYNLFFLRIDVMHGLRGESTSLLLKIYVVYFLRGLKP